jgi:hypothetical protein
LGDSMPGAFLLGLVGNSHIAALDGTFDLFASLADDDNPSRRANGIDAIEQMKQQRAAGDRMKHLVRVRAHPGTRSGG